MTWAMDMVTTNDDNLHVNNQHELSSYINGNLERELVDMNAVYNTKKLL